MLEGVITGIPVSSVRINISALAAVGRIKVIKSKIILLIIFFIMNKILKLLFYKIFFRVNK